MLLYYTRHGMNFHTCEKQIFKSFNCSKTRSDSKSTKTSRNEVMQLTSSNSDPWPIFLYHVYNQAGFDNPFIIGRGCFTWASRRRVSLFKCLQEFKVAYQKRQLERLIFDYIWACLGSPKTYCYRRFLEI